MPTDILSLSPELLETISELISDKIQPLDTKYERHTGDKKPQHRADLINFGSTCWAIRRACVRHLFHRLVHAPPGPKDGSADFNFSKYTAFAEAHPELASRVRIIDIKAMVEGIQDTTVIQKFLSDYVYHFPNLVQLNLDLPDASVSPALLEHFKTSYDSIQLIYLEKSSQLAIPSTVPIAAGMLSSVHLVTLEPEHTYLLDNDSGIRTYILTANNTSFTPYHSLVLPNVKEVYIDCELDNDGGELRWMQQFVTNNPTLRSFAFVNHDGRWEPQYDFHPAIKMYYQTLGDKFRRDGRRFPSLDPDSLSILSASLAGPGQSELEMGTFTELTMAFDEWNYVNWAVILDGQESIRDLGLTGGIAEDMDGSKFSTEVFFKTIRSQRHLDTLSLSPPIISWLLSNISYTWLDSQFKQPPSSFPAHIKLEPELVAQFRAHAFDYLLRALKIVVIYLAQELSHFVCLELWGIVIEVERDYALESLPVLGLKYIIDEWNPLGLDEDEVPEGVIPETAIHPLLIMAEQMISMVSGWRTTRPRDYLLMVSAVDFSLVQ